MKNIILALVFLSACTSSSTGIFDDSEERSWYVGNKNQCMIMKYGCPEGFEKFSDTKGCGCIQVEDVPYPLGNENTTNESDRVYCEPQERYMDNCIALYRPVCGYFDSNEVQCVKEPCAVVYSNSCNACKNELVSYYVEGECSFD